MRLVYKHAARVVVWLGLRTPGVEEAFGLAGRLGTLELDLPANSTPKEQQALADVILEKLQAVPGSLDRLTELFDREYFVRSWCLLEVVVNALVIAKCE